MTGPRPGDGFGLICPRREPITDCGGGKGFALFAVAPQVRAIWFVSGSGTRLDAVAANGWAVLPGGTARTPRGERFRATAVDAGGSVIASGDGFSNLPAAP